MPDIKWFKLSTDIFNDEKMLVIENYPEADTLFYIWVKLICMATRSNNSGWIYLSNKIAYDEESLAATMRRPQQVVKLAIEIFKRLGMIEIGEDGGIFLPTYEKHQNIDGLLRIKEQNAARNRAYRLRLKEGSDVTVTSRDATDKIRIDKKREDKNIYNKHIKKQNYNSNVKTTLVGTKYEHILEDKNE